MFAKWRPVFGVKRLGEAKNECQLPGHQMSEGMGMQVMIGWAGGYSRIEYRQGKMAW